MNSAANLEQLNPDKKVKKLVYFWMYLLILSFAYERPVVIWSSLDRLNLRLFDIAAILGILVLPLLKNQPRIKNVVFNTWSMLVVWFFVVGLFWFFQFENEIGKYCIYYALKYVEGLFVIYVLLRIPIDEKVIEKLINYLILGGIFCSCFCFYQYFSGSLREGLYEYAPGRFAAVSANAVMGPFGATYFELATYASLVTSFAFYRTLRTTNQYRWSFITAFIAFPLFISGSRTGIGLLAISLVLLAVTNARYISRMMLSTVLFVIFVSCVWLIFRDDVNFSSMDFYSIDRLTSLEGSRHSLYNRLFSFDISSSFFSQYDNSDLLPVVGAGYYVAPVNGYFRIGYGTHNIYLFVIEQGGFLGFFLFLIFILRALRIMNKGRKVDSPGLVVIVPVFCWLVACLVCGMAGQVFWHGFGTNNMNTFLVLLICLSVKLSCCKWSNVNDDKNISGHEV